MKALHRGEENAVKLYERVMTSSPRSSENDPNTPIRAGPSDVPIRERFGVSVQVAAQAIGVSRTSVYTLLSEGLIEGRIVCGKRIVLVDSLLRLIDTAPSTKRAAA